MADPRTINQPGNGTATQQFELAPGLLQYVQSVYVEVDNTAGAAARPTLTISEQSGVVIAKKRQGEAIPAAGTGSATWALRLTDEAAATGGSGIQFDTNNVGDWLQITTTSTRPASTNGIDVQATGGKLNLYSDGQATLEGSSLTLSADVGGTNLDSRQAYDMHVRNGVSEWDMDDGLAIVTSGSLTFQIGPGQILEVEDGSGNPIFRVNADGSLHGKTGKSLVFDL